MSHIMSFCITNRKNYYTLFVFIHYQLTLKAEEFTHRNGRTARMNAEGTAYVLHWEKETLPDFIETDDMVVPKGKITKLATPIYEATIGS